ncbi:hypothetical protein IMCC3088_892 [Aequoribacter fuscus]|uniref:Uncharacterized protein n=1 Tax=Aequoribacter fuscus TaxID=2518989 RepID=F3L0H1_9GAMM|nr:CsgG/HfaB family protein [Aequoribacter fuscus]EGG30189.1 hypothetical protein IMCC3088_892 [Aequoribacter fuscus]QHJ88929.1 hypothetical protein EYZ66_11780 [Aequoribacter fuscus]
MNFYKNIALLVFVFFAPVVFSQGNKPIVAVGTFDSSFRDYDTRNIQTAIETALSKTGKFMLMERGRLDQLLTEQNMSMEGLVDGGAQSLGGFGGVDYLIYGRVTQLGLEAKNLLIMSECRAKLGLDVRVVDVMTGEIRLSENITKEDGVNTSDSESNPCRGIGIEAFDNLSAAASRGLAESLTQNLFPVKIAKASDDEVYLNYGEGFLKKDEILKVVTLGEGFVDPDTGEVLGAEEELIGLVKVYSLKPNFSKARIIMQNAPMSAGDVANRLTKNEQKNMDKFIKNCQKARKDENKRCKKEGSKCDAAIEKREQACTLR